MHLKKLIFLSRQRGMRELALILVHFSETMLRTLSSEEVLEFECILSLPDLDIWEKIQNLSQAPDDRKILLMKILRAYQQPL